MTEKRNTHTHTPHTLLDLCVCHPGARAVVPSLSDDPQREPLWLTTEHEGRFLYMFGISTVTVTIDHGYVEFWFFTIAWETPQLPASTPPLGGWHPSALRQAGEAGGGVLDPVGQRFTLRGLARYDRLGAERWFQQCLSAISQGKFQSGVFPLKRLNQGGWHH